MDNKFKKLLKSMRSHIESGQDPYVEHTREEGTGQAQGVYGIKPDTAKEMANRRRLSKQNDTTDDMILNASQQKVERLLRDNAPLQERYADDMTNLISGKTKDLDVANYMWHKGHNMTEDRARKELGARDYSNFLADKVIEHNIPMSTPYDIDALNAEPVKVYPRSEPSKFKKLKKQMPEKNKDQEIKDALSLEPRIGSNDETTPASNARNALVQAGLLPESMQMTVADEKRWAAGLPEQMGMAAGTISVKPTRAPRIVEEKMRDLIIGNKGAEEDFLAAAKMNFKKIQKQSKEAEALRQELLKERPYINDQPQVMSSRSIQELEEEIAKMKKASPNDATIPGID